MLVGVLIIVFYTFWGPLSLLWQGSQLNQVDYPSWLNWFYQGIPAMKLGLGCCITLVAHCGFSWCYCRLDWLFNAYHSSPVPLEELEKELEAERKCQQRQ